MRYALVTGGNRGLGFAVCKQLARDGKPVLFTARGADAGAAAAQQLRAAVAPAAAEVVPLEADVTDAARIGRLAETVGKRYGGNIDLLVVNSGVLHKDWTPEGFAACAAVNFSGALDTALALAPHLAPGALVVVVSSSLGQLAKLTPDYTAAITGAKTLEDLRAAATRFDPASPMPTHQPFSADYSVSKAAINRAVQLLAADGSALRPPGAAAPPAIAAVCPGWCRTDMGTQAAERSADEGAASILSPWRKWAAGGDAAAAVNGSYTRDGQVLEW